MDIHSFTQQIQALTQRTTDLYQHVCSPPSQAAGTSEQGDSLGRVGLSLRMALEELQVSLEELQVAEAELYQQNEALETTHQLLQAERQRYQDLFEFAPDGYLVTDAVGVIREANRTASLLLNIAPQRLLGKPLISFVLLADRRAFRQRLEQLKAELTEGTLRSPRSGRGQEWEVRLQPRQESESQQAPAQRGRPGQGRLTGVRPTLGKQSFDAALTVAAARDAKGELSLRWLLRDVTQRKRAEAALLQNERYELALRGSDDGLWDWNLDTGQIYFSHRWKSLLGWAENEISHNSDEWFNRVHPTDVEALRQAITDHLDDRTALFEQEYRILHRNGTYRWVLSRGVVVLNADGRPYRIAGSLSDITEQKLAKARLEHDPLTGLPNRVLFMQRLTQVVESQPTDPTKTGFAVLFLDIDRFKAVNDNLGHAVGDQLLIAIAGRLKTCLRLEDTVARLGGDEFVILLRDLKAAQGATEVAERIQAALTLPFRLGTGTPGDRGGHEVCTSASIGIVLSSGLETNLQAADSLLPEELLRRADLAMYRAKHLGRGRYEVFDPVAQAEDLAAQDGLRSPLSQRL